MDVDPHHQGVSTYLEASDPRTRALSERYGFEVLGEIPVTDPDVRRQPTAGREGANW